MKLYLFRELLELNEAFDQVLNRLARMEKVRLFQCDITRYARAEVASARVDVNREFFDKSEQIVEDGVGWAYRFRREYDRKTEEVEDLYLEIKEREETRKKKGLPPRFTILPDWVLHDEEKYDEEQARKRKRSRKQRRKATRRPKPAPSPQPSLEQTGVSPTPDRESSYDQSQTT